MGAFRVPAVLPIYLAAAAQVALAQTSTPATAEITDPFVRTVLMQRAQLDPQGAEQLESYLLTSPEDLEARGRLISFYFLQGDREARNRHLFWVFEHQPAAVPALLLPMEFRPTTDPLLNSGDRERLKRLWIDHVRRSTTDAQVLRTAARFFHLLGDPDQALITLKRARELDTNDPDVLRELVNAYTAPVIAAASRRSTVGDPSVQRIKVDILASSDIPLLIAVHDRIAVARVGVLRVESDDLKYFAQLLASQAQTLGVTPLQLAPLAPPKVLQRVMPEYPQQALADGLEGDVSLVGMVGRDGRFSQLKVIHGDERLNAAALEAVSQWVLQPATRGGVPIEMTLAVHVDFRLPEGAVRPLTLAREQQAPPSHVSVGASLQRMKLIKKVDPVYPEAARRIGPQGLVRFNITTAVDGTVGKIELISGHPLLVAAAEEALKQYEYEPTLLNGEPVAVLTTVDVRFGPE